MKNRIEWAIDVFLDALNKGTLQAGDCCKCAVGNICGQAMLDNLDDAFILHHPIGIFSPKLNCLNNDWMGSFWTSEGYQHSRAGYDSPLFDITPFTKEELMKIEYAFETSTIIKVGDCTHSPERIREDQIRGLKAVIEVMMKFPGERQDKKYNEIFEERAKLLPIA